MCSVTKQFTSGLLDTFPAPALLDADIRACLPLLDGAAPGALHLCHNQSGLRDYWAIAMLHGAWRKACSVRGEAARVIGGDRTLQFAPGTRYSYCNQNFTVLRSAAASAAGWFVGPARAQPSHFARSSFFFSASWIAMTIDRMAFAFSCQSPASLADL